MAEPTDINELFSQGEKSAKEASKTSKGPIETAVSLKDRGYLPEMVTGTTAAVATGFTVKNYLKNLNAVKTAIAAEEEAVRKLRVPASKSARQPFAKEGFTLSGARDLKANMPQKGGAVPYTRLSNITAIGGPEGTGLGVLKGKESQTAAKMTAEQMVKWLRQESNLGVTATTPRIQIKGFQEGETGRKTVVVTPENVKTGKLPTTAVPAGELPRPAPTWTANLLQQPANLVNYVKGKVNFSPLTQALEKISPYTGKILSGVGVAGYAAGVAQHGPAEAALSYGVPFTKFTGIGPPVELGRGSDLESRGRWVYPADGGEPRFVRNQ
jgi:hypothetical protein